MTLPRRIASMNCSPDSMLGVELNAPIIESILFYFSFPFQENSNWAGFRVRNGVS